MAWFTEFRANDETEPYMIFFFSTLNYRLADGSLLGVEQEAAWCEGCDGFGSVEIIPSVEELRHRLQELQEPSQKHYFIYRNEEGINAARDELRIRLKWRETRKSSARCLVCGSTQIKPIHFGEDRTCVVNGRRLVEVAQGFADTADWVAEFSPEGIATPAIS